MPRKFASRMAKVWPDKVTIDIIELNAVGAGETEHYTGLKAVFAEDVLKPETGLFEEPATKAIYVFVVQPQNGQLPTIKENYQVRYNGEDLEIISVNNSSGSLQELQILTETGRL